MAILISSKICLQTLFEKRDTEGRYVFLRGNLNGSLITLLNVYAPSNSDWNFFRQLFDLIIAESQGVLIGGGISM